jgi:hypothetical protein
MTQLIAEAETVFSKYWEAVSAVRETRDDHKRVILMNDPNKFSTELGSDHALEQRTAIVSHHDTIKWFEAIPGEQLCIRVHGTQANGRPDFAVRVVAAAEAGRRHRFDLVGFSLGAAVRPQVLPLPNMKSIQ